MEYTEVQSKTKSDWVACIEWLWEFISIVVSIKSSIFNLLESGIMSWFRNVSVVVSNHFVEKCFWLIITSKAEAFVLNNVHDLHALVIQLFFNLFLVGGKSISEFLVLWILLNSSNCSDGSSLWSNQVFESNWQKVSLINGEIFSLF